jgi:L-alanine-DL-glutamate epimerase-like enolase superfamily enzyme
MKIKNLRIEIVDLPLDKPIKTSIHNIESVCAACVTLETDADICGESYLFAQGTKKIKSLYEMIHSLNEFVIGKDPIYTEGIWAEIWKNINFYGHKGITILALSTLDIACWDIKGKALSQPVYKLLGAYRDEVPIYESGGLWLSSTIEELQDEAHDFVRRGFNAMKMRVGKKDISEDIQRVAAVREAIGPKAILMVDANQGLTVQAAIKLGQKLLEYDIFWFEEPVAAYDYEGSAQVRSSIPGTYLASGETEYTRYGFKQLIDAKSANLLMPDLSRVGGITEFMKVAHFAEAMELPISPHLYTEHSLQLMGALPNGMYLEHMPWFSSIFNEEIEVTSGMATIPKRPGLGFTFNKRVLEKYKVRI